jgi:hypothetical protein
VKTGIRDFLKTATGRNLSLNDHLNLHLFFVLELARNWRAYINFLEAQLVELVGYRLKFNVTLAKQQIIG